MSGPSCSLSALIYGVNLHAPKLDYNSKLKYVNVGDSKWLECVLGTTAKIGKKYEKQRYSSKKKKSHFSNSFDHTEVLFELQ